MNEHSGDTCQEDQSPSGDVAIIGMACLFPGAPDLDSYWQNIVSKTDAISDPPSGAWDPTIFYDPTSTANDRVYCKRGGFIGDLAQFRPFDFGIMPLTVDGGEPDQWLALQVAHAAMADAGYSGSPKERARTAVILGKGTYINRGNMTVGYHGLIVEQVLQVLKNLHPEYSDAEVQAIKQELKAGLPPFSADTAPALIGNIIAGRIANRLDLMGPSYTVDAACASGLLAVEMGIRDLVSRKCDLALVGGVNVNTPLPTSILFCQLGALSRREQIRPFDKDADGTILGEGLGMLVLKRLEDAKRDEDRIYAVIKGVGSASDGRALHVMAPRVEGEELALRRAYEMAGVSPRTIGLIEAHGTATPVGDAVEIQALARVFGERQDQTPTCALGSVKSMIGHTMPAAGIAGLIKTALSLYHRTLPPTLHCDEPNPELHLERTPFYINTETRPWIHGAPDAPRRAGVNSFGFGGANAHVVLEECPDNDMRDGYLLHWETEAFILEAGSRQQLIERVGELQNYLTQAVSVSLKDLAYTLNTQLRDAPYRLAVVATSSEDLLSKLGRAADRLSDPKCRQIKDSGGIYFFEERLGEEGRLALMFPGEGAQYPNMLLDLCLHFPEVRACFDLADRAFVEHPRNYLPSDFIFPRSIVSERERSEMEMRLWQIDGAVESVLIANRAMWTLLSRLEIRPEVIVGHSTGDYSAMFASGVIELTDDASYVKTILSWNAAHERLAATYPPSEVTLIAVASDSDTLKTLIDDVGVDVHIAMDNCPHQTVFLGTKAAAERVIPHLRNRGLIYEILPFDRPYHTPMFQPYAEGAGREFFSQLPISAPKIDLYSCTTAQLYPTNPEDIRKLFVDHWVRPVLFGETIKKMYADGIRIFVETGPRGNLTAFVDDILRGEPHLAIPSNVARRSGITQLNHLVGMLAAQGIGMKLDYLYARRKPQRLSWEPSDTEASTSKATQAPMKLAIGMPQLHVAPRKRKPVPETVAGPSRAVPPAGKPDTMPHSLAQRAAGAGPDNSGTLSTIAPGRASGNTSVVMQEYLKGMERFLDLQQQVTQAFIQRLGVRSPVSGNPSASAVPQNFPLLGTVTSLVPGQELTALRRLDTAEDLFLREHALGYTVSVTDPALKPTMVVPLTMSMEILAEAGAALMPERVLVGMRDVRAHHWIRVEDEPVSLQISARRTTPDEVDVQVRILTPAAEQEHVAALPAIRGIMIFADQYPTPWHDSSFALTNEKVSRLSSAKLYEGGLMFHGPCFQGVASVLRSGRDGLVGELRVLPSDSLFRSVPSPRFVTDPVVLDAAGQLVGFWTAEHLQRGFVVFPYRLEALRVYGPNRPAGESATCRLKLHLLGDELIRSNLEILDADGNPWMHLSGWEDRRFDLPEQFHRFWISPRDASMSWPWKTPIESFPEKNAFECYRIEPLFGTDNIFWNDLCASLTLSRRERKEFENLSGPEIRRLEWLNGRIAAKDAVRAFLKKHCGLELFPADIEIAKDEHGRPIARGSWTDKLAVVPALSLAHSNSVAVAVVAGRGGEHQRVGIDLELIRELTPDFEDVAFTAGERRLFASIPAKEYTEWVLRLWCAKEAIGKALGRGLLNGPHSVEIRTLDQLTGMMGGQLQGKLALAFPDLAGVEIFAHTGREKDYVFASTFCQRKIQ